ncbi:MAG: DUF4147 domain-containing protein [Planctomycetaceae bacterium]|nr:DUF4147 domain-containing protein [Planctomycetaceae bacterium]
MSDLREHALSIWQAGVSAVDSEHLVRSHVAVDEQGLKICGQTISLNAARHIEVVGAGKAGAGMVRGLEQALAGLPHGTTLGGWVNVPEDCVGPTQHIRLFGARPAGVNEPTITAAEGTTEILRRVGQLDEQDICVVLISGGGSALLPAPVPEITLQDKLTVTRTLAAAATPIDELNLVRRELSLVKGGGLLAACRAQKVVALIISDVIGDPLAAIASGPTVAAASEPRRALDILCRCDPDRQKIDERVFRYLEQKPERDQVRDVAVTNHLLGANAVAVAAAHARATELGYDVVSLGSENSGHAAALGCRMLDQLRAHRNPHMQRPLCVLAGGETTVELTAYDGPRKGGRNQEMVLAAVNACPAPAEWSGLVLLSGGTDGEDGPTDAAGAVADQQLLERLSESRLQAADFLAINNSYPFFERLDGLIRTGPTHTNVMDLAVGLVAGK